MFQRSITMVRDEIDREQASGGSPSFLEALTDLEYLAVHFQRLADLQLWDRLDAEMGEFTAIIDEARNGGMTAAATAETALLAGGNRR